MNSLTSAVAWSQQFLLHTITPGDFVIDATAGNGNDTLFLANHVLPGGLVWAMDIQQRAIEATETKLREAGIDNIENILTDNPEQESLVKEGVVLFRWDHSLLATLLQLTKNQRPPVRAAIFNLGYLPGGDRSIVTQPATTIKALDALAQDLAGGGRLIVVVYVGHEGAEVEAPAVHRWWQCLSPQQWDTVAISFPNRLGHPPYVLLAEKKNTYEGGCQ